MLSLVTGVGANLGANEIIQRRIVVCGFDTVGVGAQS